MQAKYSAIELIPHVVGAKRCLNPYELYVFFSKLSKCMSKAIPPEISATLRSLRLSLDIVIVKTLAQIPLNVNTSGIS